MLNLITQIQFPQLKLICRTQQRNISSYFTLTGLLEDLRRREVCLNASLRENDQHDAHFFLINPLNAELNPICYLLALLGAHHFLHVSRIRVKSLTLRLLMSYIYVYMENLFLMFLDHTQRRSTVGRTPLDE